MPVTAVRTALSPGHVQPSRPKLCVQTACRYAFFQAIFQPAIREPMLPSDSHPGPLRPGCAQPLFAIMHRSRAAFLQLLRQVMQVKQRGRRVVAVADPGSRQVPECRFSRVVIAKGLARQHHRTAPLVLRTRLQSPRSANEFGKHLALPGTERVDLVPVEQHRERWTSRSTRQRRRGPAYRRPRTARARGDTWGAETTWSTGFALPAGRTGALARPGPDRQPTVAVVRIQGWMRHS
jgi:hypothetical protein